MVKLIECQKLLFSVLSTTQSYFSKNLRDVVGDEYANYSLEATWGKIKKHFIEKYDKLYKKHIEINRNISILKSISVKYALLNAMSDKLPVESDVFATVSETPIKSKLI